MRINERLRIAVYGALCMCVCVFSACLFALMKRFHLATVLVVGSVCLRVCRLYIQYVVCLLPQSK